MESYAINLESYLIPASESNIDYSQRPRLFLTKFRSTVSNLNVLANTILKNNNSIPDSEDFQRFITTATAAKGFMEDVLTNNSIEELSTDADFIESIEGLDTPSINQKIETLSKIALISTVALTASMKLRPQLIKNSSGALAWFKFVVEQFVLLYNGLFNK